MSIVRVKSDVSAVVRDPASGELVTLRGGDEYEHDDPVAKEYGWAFQSDSKSTGQVRRRSVTIEQATAAPGERR